MTARHRVVVGGGFAAVSRYYAIEERGRVRISGFAGWLVWLAFLTGFNNRVSALFHWTISFFGRSRAERTITAQQVFARTRGSRAARRGSGVASTPERVRASR